ncbi:MAG: AGE family epimerase/isomerase [Chloroflexota bacterium]|nr:AGE family epimerase/isomerase [Chloroflexota bacterium]
MRYSNIQTARYGLILFCIVLLAGCTLPGILASSEHTSLLPAQPSQAEGTIDALVDQVLTNMHQHAWNPRAMTKGLVTGGLFINWKMSDPSITNATRPGPTGDAQNDHDPQVDLLYLTALAEYRQPHPSLHTYDGDVSRVTTLVLADFKRYSVPKGWIYFYLLKSGLLLQNTDLVNEAHTLAENFYTTWYDPALGNVYDRLHTPGDYTPNHTLQCGAALIDAGQRWREPDLVSAGERTIEHVIAAAFNTRYHLFYDTMVVGGDGQDHPHDPQARPSTQGEAVSALVTAYTLTHRQQYLDIAGQVLQSLFGASGLWDTARGGFFFALEMDSGQLKTDYKETRSQSLTLIGLHLYNQARQQRFALQQQQLTAVLSEHFYQRTYHGFVYRLTPDFQIYVSKPGAGIGVEDYFTTEAMGSALDALQQGTA